MFVEQYYNNVHNTLGNIKEHELEKITLAGKKVAEAIKANALVHVFGCGHSHMVSEELFYRAGGLVPINPIFDTGAMLHEGARRSSAIERLSGYAKLTLYNYKISPNDIFLVVSNSGINSYPIEMAEEAKKKGAYVIGITSEFYKDVPSRHPQKLHLLDVCDMYINNHVNYGDASIAVTEDGVKSGPLSSISTFFIANSIILSACQRLSAENIIPPIFTSGNIPQGDSQNIKFLNNYQYRIKHL